MLDDLFTYRLDGGRFLTVTNAANHEKDLAWFREQAEGFDVEVRDALDDWAMLAVQGPEARDAVSKLAAGELPPRMRTADVELAGVWCLVCGTGYTGEDGVEVMVPPDGAAAVWDALVQHDVAPAGLGARDTLRLEVCLPAVRQRPQAERTPVEAGLGWCVKLDTDFVGVKRMRDQVANRTAELLAPFVFTGPGIPATRQHGPVRRRSWRGVVTSGTLSPCMDVGIGMAYVRAHPPSPAPT